MLYIELKDVPAGVQAYENLNALVWSFFKTFLALVYYLLSYLSPVDQENGQG